MLLSTAIPIVIAAIVIVIISKGIPSRPIIPKIKNAAIKLGMTPISASFKNSLCSAKTLFNTLYPIARNIVTINKINIAPIIVNNISVSFCYS